MEYRTSSRAIKNAVEGLAYWIADENYLRERYGNEEPEIKTCQETIHDIFTELDALRVPFWVQNSVIAFAENWRQYKTNYTCQYLTKKNIYICQ